jgi:ribosome biogenesis GTPase A
MDMYQKREMRKNKKMDENTKSLPSTSINWYPGHMAKTKRQITEDLKLIDVVIEVLDARIPVSSQNPDMKELTKNKKKIYILNKSDLADEKETLKWENKLRTENSVAISCDSNSGKGINKVEKTILNLMQEEQEKNSQKGRTGKPIRVLVLGIPNVGKSSFINRISKKTTMAVGNKPGVTKQKQWIRLSNNIELLDTPGVLWPKFENKKVALNLSFTGTIKDEILPKVEIAYRLLKFLIENYKSNVLERYKLDENVIQDILSSDNQENIKIYDIMCLIGKKRGCIVSGGNIDDEKVSNIILDDYRTGKLGNITLEKVEK